MLIKNNLNFDIDAFIKPDDGNRRGAGEPDGQGRNQTKVPANGGKLKVHIDAIPREQLKLFFKLPQLPSANNKTGVKIIPGTNPGVPHHFEFLNEGNSYEAIVHYNLSGKSDKEKESFITHVDPQVEHPD